MTSRSVDPKLAKAIEADMAEIDGKTEEPKKVVQVEDTNAPASSICPMCNNTGLDGVSAQAGICPMCQGAGGGERSEVSVDHQPTEEAQG